MPEKTFTTEQIISKVREADALISQEQTELQKWCSNQPLLRLRASVYPRD